MQQKFLPILTFILFVSTCALTYILFFPTSAPQTQQPSTNSAQGTEAAATPVLINPDKAATANISQAEIRRLRDVENQQKELELLLERISSDLKEATSSKDILAQLLLGRTVLRDFEKRFLSSIIFRKSGGFLNYFRQKTQAYLKDGVIRIDPAGIKKKEMARFRKELASWLLVRSEKEIESSARFMSFFFAETLYEIPLTMLASRMTPELEEINFDTPVSVKNVLTTPSRNSNGEMNESAPTILKKYTIPQQFFFRRGAKITRKTVVFLKAYLSYTDL